MSLANYADLQASIAGWLHRTDLTAIIPDFITLAEKRINGDLDARMQDTIVTLTTSAGIAFVASPADVINIRSLNLLSNPNVALDYMAPDQFNKVYADGRAGLPQAYNIVGSNIYLAPTPDAAYPIQMTYKAQVPSLAANGTNYLMTNYPQTYLMAALCESAKYTVNDPRLQMWEMAYGEAIKSVNMQDWANGSTMRVRVDVRA